MNLLKTKICVSCNLEKSTDNFYKDESRKSGLSTYCKECIKENRTKYRTNNKEKVSNTKKIL